MPLLRFFFGAAAAVRLLKRRAGTAATETDGPSSFSAHPPALSPAFLTSIHHAIP